MVAVKGDYSGNLIKRTIYSSGSGTHTFDTATKTFQACGIGGGGGGGAAGTSSTPQASAAAGGGGAGFFDVLLTLVGTTATYAVGAKGTGSTSATSGGGNGGDTTLTHNSITYTAGKGTGGAPQQGGTSAAIASGGAGGTVTNGDLQVAGQDGQDGIRRSATDVVSGDGGDSQFGTGGRSSEFVAAATGATNGQTAKGYGAGGSGGVAIRNVAGSSTANGGDGTAGFLMIEEWT